MTLNMEFIDRRAASKTGRAKHLILHLDNDKRDSHPI